MSAGLIPMFHRRLQKPGWKQALVLLALLLFVLSAIFPANRGGSVSSGASMAIPSPSELLFCDGSRDASDDAKEDPADQVRYVDGLGFVIPGYPGQRRPSLKLSENF